MKQRNIRAFSLILIFALCLSLLSACSSGKNASSGNGNINLAESSPAPISAENAEFSVKTILEERNDFGIIGKICPADGGTYIDCQIYNRENYLMESSLYFADKNGEIKKIDTPWLDGDYINFMCAAEGGGLLLYKSTYIDKENSEYELCAFKNGEYSTILKPELPEFMQIIDMCAAKGLIFLSITNNRGTNLIEAYTYSGEKKYELNLRDSYFKLISDGDSLYLENRGISDTSFSVSRIEPENGNFKEIASFESGYLLSCKPGKIYLGDNVGALEYDIASGSSSRILRWTDCGLSGSGTSLWPYENGKVVVGGREGIKIVVLGAKKERQQVTLAIGSNANIYSMSVYEFNQNSDEYEVIIKDYGAYPDPQQMLNTDILSGKGPDLIEMTYFSGEIIKPGTMMDLLKFIEADPDLSEEDFLKGPLDAMKAKSGELLAISPLFFVYTLVSRTGEAGEVSQDGVVAALEKIGSPEEAFDGTLSQSLFLKLAFCCGDADKYSRNDIAAIIEYASHLPYRDESYEEKERKNPRLTLSIISTVLDPTELVLGTSKSVDVNYASYIGLPFCEGSGVILPFKSFAIPANSANADGAWAFLKSFLLANDNELDKYYSSGIMGFPINKSFYESIKLNERKGRGTYYTTSSGNDAIYEFTSKDFDISFERIDALLAGLSGVFDNDAKAYEIVTDACGAYFAGQKSLEATADEIMSRSGIYFSKKN